MKMRMRVLKYSVLCIFVAYMKVTQAGSCLALIFDTVAISLLVVIILNKISENNKKIILQLSTLVVLVLAGEGTLFYKT